MGISKRTIISFIILFLATLLVTRHCMYVNSLSPLLRDVLTHKGSFPETGHWSYDATSEVEKHARLGVTKDEVLSFIKASDLIIQPAPELSEKHKKKYEYTLVAYQYLRAGFAGLSAIFGTSYTFTIEFNFNNNKLENYRSGLVVNTI